METFIIIYVVSYLLSSIIIKWSIKHNNRFVNELKRDDVFEDFQNTVYVPVFNTIICVVWIIDFLRGGCDIDKMKN